MTAPPVTFILPVRNGMPWLPETLASIEAQTCRDFEILAWDNGSTDGTRELLASWIPSRIPGRAVLDRPFPMLAQSLRQLVIEAESEFVARIDADDLCAPERVARQLAALRANPRWVGVGSAATLIDERGNKLPGIKHSMSSPEDLRFLLVYTNPFTHPSMMLRRSAVLEVGNYAELRIVEDHDLWMRLTSLGPIANLAEPLLAYRMRANSEGHAREKDWPRLHRELLSRHGDGLFPGSLEEDRFAVQDALSGFQDAPRRGRAVGEAVIRLAVAARRATAWKDTDFLATRAVWNAYARCVPRAQRSLLRLIQMSLHRTTAGLRAP